MPEYLTPGVYIEETSFRSKSIQGVSTSTAGFIGPTLTGPLTGEPELLTSFADFVRIYGGLGDIAFADGSLPNYLAHGVRSFFQEGGSRCYVTRIFNPKTSSVIDFGIASGIPANHYGQINKRDDQASAVTNPPYIVIARFPGAYGDMRVHFTLKLSSNVAQLATVGGTPVLNLSRTRNYDLVLARVNVDPAPVDPTAAESFTAYGAGTDGFYMATRNDATGVWTLTDGATNEILQDGQANFDAVTSDAALNFNIRTVTVTVEVQRPGEEPNTYLPRVFLGEFSLDPRSAAAVTSTFAKMPSTRYLELTTPFALDSFQEGDGTDIDLENDVDDVGLHLIRNLFDYSGTLNPILMANVDVDSSFTLSGGGDGNKPVAPQYTGDDTGLVDYINDTLNADKNGFLTLREKEDVSIVVATGYTAYGNEDAVFSIQNSIINHCEQMVYRVALLDTPRDYLVSQTLNFRNRRSSDFAAIYYPWVRSTDPRPSKGGASILLPPSGHMAGIWARNDVENAVFKAPANEVVRTAVSFELNVNRAQQAVLNPQGVNCLRFFEGRGNLVWGARTITDDSDWTYVNVRRYFAYLERSIDVGTQWVVFENNDPRLWDQVRGTIESFLFNEWRAGGLLGNKPEDAYFVVCDRSTMTQQDLDQGRLICLIGVAPVKPAEFVIFRIGQFTADNS